MRLVMETQPQMIRRMKHALAIFLLAAGMAASCQAGDLDGAAGRIFDVDLESRTFELLKETEYDPVTAAGRSRFTVNWSEETKIIVVQERESFDWIKTPVFANFYGIDAAGMRAFEAGEPFVARVVVLHTTAEGIDDIEGEKNGVFGWFTPNEGKRAGTLRVGERDVPVSLRQQNWKIFLRSTIPAQLLVTGFWKTKIQGARDEAGRFMVSQMEVEQLPDPRLEDDPKRPRVLVIGDSISMNYHDEAKQALAGVANYHRIEGNSFTSAHGVNNAELWLGNYEEKGLHWDVILFNHGLHDLRQTYDAATQVWGPPQVEIPDYQANLERLIAILKKSGATLVWTSTTPVQRDILGQYARRKGAAAEYNLAALEVMKRHPDILINDLHAVVDGSPAFDAWRKTSDVHFYQPAERKALGKAVAEAVRAAVARRPQ
jgi:acyl-CoA thioesterase-1